jgi:formamidopyrimidine-DNA glycosylase
MPELPEVETVAQKLRREPSLLGRRIDAVRVLWPREIDKMPPEVFASAVTGARVSDVGRIGKFVLITLESGGAQRPMLVHLRMSGRLDVVPEQAAFTKHARVVWLLDNGYALCFDDARKFGRVYLPNSLEDITGKIGPDALQVEFETFWEKLRVKRGALKSVLLDQRFIAGVGNIYADESLHRALLKPTRKALTVKEADARRLYDTIREVLHEGIAANGASFDWVYPGGNFQENFRVYGQTGKPCPRCGAPIQRIVLGQRSTHYCARCQK